MGDVEPMVEAMKRLEDMRSLLQEGRYEEAWGLVECQVSMEYAMAHQAETSHDVGTGCGHATEDEGKPGAPSHGGAWGMGSATNWRYKCGGGYQDQEGGDGPGNGDGGWQGDDAAGHGLSHCFERDYLVPIPGGGYEKNPDGSVKTITRSKGWGDEGPEDWES